MIRLKSILNEMAMKPTLEKEFEKIVRSFQDEYEKFVGDIIRDEIRKATPIVASANKDAIASGKMFTVYEKTFGYNGSLSDRRNGFSYFLRNHVFFSKEHASSKVPSFKKEIDDKWQRIQDAEKSGKSTDEIQKLRNDWKIEQGIYVKMPESYWAAALDKEAKHASEMFYTSFIKKNVEKFSDVIKGKDIVVIKHNLQPKSLSGNLIVECSDGSKFRASFSVETSVSKNGKWFNRYPTRFHDVVLSDGTKMASPSESKMKKDF